MSIQFVQPSSHLGTDMLSTSCTCFHLSAFGDFPFTKLLQTSIMHGSNPLSVTRALPNPTPSLIIRSPPAAYTLHFLPRLALPCRVSHLLHRLLLLSPVAASPSNHLRLIRVCAPAPPGSRAVFCRNCWPKNRLLIWRRGRTRSLELWKPSHQ